MTQDPPYPTGTIIKHRTSVILAALPKALKFGKSDLGPDGEGEVLKVCASHVTPTHLQSEIFQHFPLVELRHAADS